MRIAFIGPPGAGKSTQAKRISRSLPYHNRSPRFSTGGLIRAEIEAGTEIGHEVRSLYERGERVPDATIFSLVLPRLRRSGGFMLDNFPATASQAAVLDEDLDERGAGGLSRVILLEGPSDEELLERILSGRITSRATGDVYHTRHDPPPSPEEGLDPGPFERRDDDTEEAVRAHLEAYRAEADALKTYYEERGVLSVVEARRPIKQVSAEILDALGNPESPRFYAPSARS
jgi:adenylate kinase